MGLHSVKQVLNLLISISIAAAMPVPLMAASSPSKEFQPDAQELAQMKYDQQLIYWGDLRQNMPEVAHLAFADLNKELGPTWLIQGQNSLLDSDPFFMRSQSWVNESDSSSCTAENKNNLVCFKKNADGVTLTVAGHPRSLRLNQAFTPVLETSEHIFFAADNLSIFQQKLGSDEDPGEGLFFIAKKDLYFAGDKTYPVPVFYFPLPGNGWTGSDRKTLDFEIVDQVVVYSESGFGLQIERDDIALMEKVQRQNLLLGITFAFLDGEMDARGVALPKANSTLAFGLFLSGQTTGKTAANDSSLDKIKSIAGQMAREILPQAQAHDAEKERELSRQLELEITRRAKQAGDEPKHDWTYWKKWLLNGAIATGVGVATYGAYHPIDFSNMITAEMPNQVATVAKMIGAVAVASIVMKYSIHRAHFDKLYPIKAEDSFLRKLNQHHKGIMSELAYGLYFSLASIPQGLRHSLAFLKERFIPQNKTVHKAWDATMGWQMRQNSQLPMNYKTQYYGWMFGLQDSILVALTLLVFGPWVINHFGLSVNVGHATAAYATAETLRNFLAYLQSGAHGYSAEVKFIHLRSAEQEARSALESAGLNPDAERNRQRLTELTELNLAKRYKTVGLPGQDEFLYDPITVLESTTHKSGFQAPPELKAESQRRAKAVEDAISAGDKVDNMPQPFNFILEHGNWGLVHPSLKKALKEAKRAQAAAPSRVGAQTVATLEWALQSRSSLKHVAGRAWDVASSKWAKEGLRAHAETAVAEYWSNSKSPNTFGTSLAYARGALKYLASDASKPVREIRQALYLGSTTGELADVGQYMPQSWRDKAGSDAAAAASAQLFHRAFYSYYEHNKNVITPSAAAEAKYGSQAAAMVTQEAQKDPALNDPFMREIRTREVVHQLKAKDDARDSLVYYWPKVEGSKQVWQIARDRAKQMWAQESDVDPIWQGMAAQVAKKTETNDSEKLNPIEWSNGTRYKLLVAREYARHVGLISDGSESDFVQKVIVDASVKTKNQLSSRREAYYVDHLPEKDREFYEAQVFTKHFINSYIELGVNESENLKGGALAYPGRFQKVRRALVGVPGGKFMSGVLRSFEAAFRNEATSYKATMGGWLNRNIPLVPDMYHNFVRNLRVMPYLLTLSYLTSYYIWQIKTPYALWGITFFIGFVNPTLVEINNRLQRNFNSKPMEDVPSKLLYGWFHGFLTNPELAVVQAYSQPMVDSFDRNVVQPVKDIPSRCEKLLFGETKP